MSDETETQTESSLKKSEEEANFPPPPVSVKTEEAVKPDEESSDAPPATPDSEAKKDNEAPTDAAKRERQDDMSPEEEVGDSAKKAKTVEDVPPAAGELSEPATVLPSKEGYAFFNDNDVLAGRGGGTNVHPGNRNFRDLINHYRRGYLKARKNDKPTISRAVVRAIRESNGRFLKKDDKTGLWFEIGDDAAREKTSQALRQRASEMRKMLFDSEREEARATEEHLRQQRILMGMPPGVMPIPGMTLQPGTNPMAYPAFFMATTVANHGAKAGFPPGAPGTAPHDPYSHHMFQAAFMNNNMRFDPPPNHNGSGSPHGSNNNDGS